MSSHLKGKSRSRGKSAEGEIFNVSEMFGKLYFDMPRMDSLSVQGKLICLQTAEINGVCTKDCFVGLFFSFLPIIFIALGKKGGGL